MKHSSKSNNASIISQDWHHLNCYGCGPSNKYGLHADFTFCEESGEVRFEYTIPIQFEGAPGYTHGGVLASLLDEAQGVLCFHLGHFVMTDRLYINYHRATPLNTQLTIRAWLTMVRRKRLYSKGKIYNSAQELLVSSKARWFVFRPLIFGKIFKNKFSEKELDRLTIILEKNRQRGKKIRKRLREKKNK
jgi:acyl-coenzyme A thioesterase PaaI-like protein